MVKVIYYTAASLDGFIADEHHSLDWLFEVPHAGDDQGDDGSWDAFIGRIGTLVIGATTYAWMLDHHPAMLEGPDQWREFYGERPAVVLTHRTDLPTLPGVDLRFASGDVRPVYDEIVAARPDQDIWVVGGGDVVGQFDDAGLLDEIQVHVTPVVLGAGAPLLPRRITSSRLRFREATHLGQRVNVTLDVARRGPDVS
jgi:dihydrofolate reductase